MLNLVTLGKYSTFIENAIRAMDIQSEDKILDLGAGSGYNAEYMVNYLNSDGIKEIALCSLSPQQAVGYSR